MHAFAEVLAFLIGFLSVIMVGVSLQNPYWRVSSDDGNVIRTSTIYENLWMSCASDSTGVFNCRDFPSLFALPGKVPGDRRRIGVQSRHHPSLIKPLILSRVSGEPEACSRENR